MWNTIAGSILTIGGEYNYREGVSVWYRSFLAFHPDPTLMAEAPLGFQLHALVAFGLFALWPFTRLVHVFSAPVGLPHPALHRLPQPRRHPARQPPTAPGLGPGRLRCVSTADAEACQPIAELMDEHTALVDLAHHLRQDLGAGRPSAATAGLAVLVADLERHVQREEKGIFSALRAARRIHRRDRGARGGAPRLRRRRSPAWRSVPRTSRRG